MRVLITGANGFIGSHLCREFAANGHEVVAVLRSKTSDRQLIQDLKSLKVVYCDMSDYDTLPDKLTERVDLFYHLAWRGVFREHKSNYALQMENCKSTLDAARISKELGARRFVSIGTMTEFIITKTPFQEIGSPSLMYALTKYYTHCMLKLYCGHAGIPYIWAILANTYGAGNVTGNVLSYLIQNLGEGNHVSLSSGNSYYDFIYIQDCVHFLYLLGREKVSGSEYYIGSGSPGVLRDYFEEVRKIVAPYAGLGLGEVPEDRMVYQRDWFDISPLEAEFGQSPAYTFPEGIKEMLREMRCNGAN